MGARLAQKEKDEAAVDMTPMLDIVFIMLIFFIVTATFVKQSGLEVIRPPAETAEDQRRVSILIAVGDGGEVWMDNKEVDVRSVRAGVEKLLAENPLGSVVIQADTKSKSGILMQVMDQVRQAGAPGTAIATEKD
ncbi:MAG: biopolymer transporter ExbD [Rhodospirillaceae bacterium]|nr:biopolymer transporter ExbD [Rhodospirillaceae bacterium]